MNESKWVIEALRFSAPGSELQLFIMSAPSNFSEGVVAQEKQCIINDQMGPFTVFYIFIFVISLPGNLLSVWAFICSPRAKVGLLRWEDVRVRRDEVKLIIIVPCFTFNNKIQSD